MYDVGSDRIAMRANGVGPAAPAHAVDRDGDVLCRQERPRYHFPSLDWMGIPLKIGEESFGALVLQTYEPNIRYGEREKEILTFVSQQIASAIETKRLADARVPCDCTERWLP